MPTKRTRRGHHREDLSPAQESFLRGEALPDDAPFEARMQLIWLSQKKRDGPPSQEMPDGSPAARDLWEAYGASAIKERARRRVKTPHPLIGRFGEPAPEGAAH